MKIGILGTGMVGQALGTRLVHLGHSVVMGGRTPKNADVWAEAQGAGADAGDFRDAADHAEIAILAVQGGVALSVASSAEPELSGKILIDVTNPLDFSAGFPPKLIQGLQNDYSLGEALQDELPDTHVVKALNTMSNRVMVDPGSLDGPTDVFVAGNEERAKEQVTGLLMELGWEAPVDLGGIEMSRGLEAWLLFWTRAMGPMGGDGMFNLKLVGATARA